MKANFETIINDTKPVIVDFHAATNECINKFVN